MPLYEYYCGKCDQKFEMLRSVSMMDETTSCPAGHPGAGRVLSLIARSRTGGGTGGVGDFDDFGAEADPDEFGGCACGGDCSCG